MPKCENCYHESACKGIMNNVDAVYNPQKESWIMPKNCLGYKDKSLIIELPCKVGDTVYRISTMHHTKRKYIQETRISRIAIDVDGIWLFCNCNPIAKCVFGKTLFLTREEAEKALREREKNE